MESEARSANAAPLPSGAYGARASRWNTEHRSGARQRAARDWPPAKSVSALYVANEVQAGPVRCNAELTTFSL
eukprot:789542-Pleurochrysis_carterae.AAC.1